MSLFQTIFLGIIEGLTEFLPVSSTAHLMIVSRLFGVADSEFLKTFEIAIQLGAICAVLVLYFKKIFSDFSLIKNVAVGFVPTATTGFLFYGIFKSLLGNIYIALATLFFGGIVLILFEKFSKPKNDSTSLTTSEQLDLKKSFTVGLWQPLAMIPGVSRSMATILGGMMTGLSKQAAVEFSFLLALPTMFSATVYDIYKSYSLFSFSEWQTLGIGFLIAFLSALVSVKWFLGFISKNSFANFGWYRITFTILIFAILF